MIMSIVWMIINVEMTKNTHYLLWENLLGNWKILTKFVDS